MGSGLGSGLEAELAGLRVGVHMPLAAGMVKAVGRARTIGANTLQVFGDNPSSWRRRDAPPAELAAFRALLIEQDLLPLALHGPYLLNLAGPDETIRERSVVTLAHELRTGATFGAAFVNVHLGSHRGSGAGVGILRVGEAVTRALADVPPSPSDSEAAPLLVLENSAGGGDGIGGTVEELEAVLEAIAAAGGDAARVGFCLDTAHAFAAGYDLSNPDVTDAFLMRCDQLLGVDRIVMVHLNDSKSLLGSHADRHEHLGAGGIGEGGLRHLLRHDRLRRVPFYLETPGMAEGYDAVNMERVRLLIRGEPLPGLPSAAGLARSARARSGPP